MFGRIDVTEMLRVDRREPVETAVARLLVLAEIPEVTRWVQFPSAVVVFLVVPGDPSSGAIYVLERRTGTWFWVDFHDEAYGGYTETDFDLLMSACRFARLAERPRLLGTCRWSVKPGLGPELLGSIPAGAGICNHRQRERFVA
ncbi:MAG: hypothetical protein ACYDDI_11450 [Candidatus Acidiferrales bacterium]